MFGDVTVQVRLQLEALTTDEAHKDLTRVDTKQMFPATTAAYSNNVLKQQQQHITHYLHAMLEPKPDSDTVCGVK